MPESNENKERKKHDKANQTEKENIVTSNSSIKSIVRRSSHQTENDNPKETHESKINNEIRPNERKITCTCTCKAGEACSCTCKEDASNPSKKTEGSSCSVHGHAEEKRGSITKNDNKDVDAIMRNELIQHRMGEKKNESKSSIVLSRASKEGSKEGYINSQSSLDTAGHDKKSNHPERDKTMTPNSSIKSLDKTLNQKTGNDNPENDPLANFELKARDSHDREMNCTCTCKEDDKNNIKKASEASMEEKGKNGSTSSIVHSRASKDGSKDGIKVNQIRSSDSGVERLVTGVVIRAHDESERRLESDDSLHTKPSSIGRHTLDMESAEQNLPEYHIASNSEIIDNKSDKIERENNSEASIYSIGRILRIRNEGNENNDERDTQQCQCHRSSNNDSSAKQIPKVESNHKLIDNKPERESSSEASIYSIRRLLRIRNQGSENIEERYNQHSPCRRSSSHDSPGKRTSNEKSCHEESKFVDFPSPEEIAKYIASLLCDSIESAGDEYEQTNGKRCTSKLEKKKECRKLLKFIRNDYCEKARRLIASSEEKVLIKGERNGCCHMARESCCKRSRSCKATDSCRARSQCSKHMSDVECDTRQNVPECRSRSPCCHRACRHRSSTESDIDRAHRDDVCGRCNSPHTEHKPYIQKSTSSSTGRCQNVQRSSHRALTNKEKYDESGTKLNSNVVRHSINSSDGKRNSSGKMNLIESNQKRWCVTSNGSNVKDSYVLVMHSFKEIIQEDDVVVYFLKLISEVTSLQFTAENVHVMHGNTENCRVYIYPRSTQEQRFILECFKECQAPVEVELCSFNVLPYRNTCSPENNQNIEVHEQNNLHKEVQTKRFSSHSTNEEEVKIVIINPSESANKSAQTSVAGSLNSNTTNKQTENAQASIHSQHSSKEATPKLDNHSKHSDIMDQKIDNHSKHSDVIEQKIDNHSKHSDIIEQKLDNQSKHSDIIHDIQASSERIISVHSPTNSSGVRPSPDGGRSQRIRSSNHSTKCIETSQNQKESGNQRSCPCPKSHVCAYRYGQVIGNEDRTLEFKSWQGNMCKLFAETVCKYMTAFLNGDGGTLMFGVNDYGEVIGVPDCDQRREDNLRTRIDSAVKLISPPVFPPSYRVKFVPVIDDKDILIPNLKVIEICTEAGASDDLYQTHQGEVYIRRDGSVQGPLKAGDIQEWTRTSMGQKKKGNMCNCSSTDKTIEELKAEQCRIKQELWCLKQKMCQQESDNEQRKSDSQRLCHLLAKLESVSNCIKEVFQCSDTQSCNEEDPRCPSDCGRRKSVRVNEDNHCSCSIVKNHKKNCKNKKSREKEEHERCIREFCARMNKSGCTSDDCRRSRKRDKYSHTNKHKECRNDGYATCRESNACHRRGSNRRCRGGDDCDGSCRRKSRKVKITNCTSTPSVAPRSFCKCCRRDLCECRESSSDSDECVCYESSDSGSEDERRCRKTKHSGCHRSSSCSPCCPNYIYVKPCKKRASACCRTVHCTQCDECCKDSCTDDKQQKCQKPDQKCSTPSTKPVKKPPPQPPCKHPPMFHVPPPPPPMYTLPRRSEIPPLYARPLLPYFAVPPDQTCQMAPQPPYPNRTGTEWVPMAGATMSCSPTACTQKSGQNYQVTAKTSQNCVIS